MTSLQGQLLISAGGLFDPNFRHTVVLIGAHYAGGAVGVILNRPLDVTVHDPIPTITNAAIDPDQVERRQRDERVHRHAAAERDAHDQAQVAERDVQTGRRNERRDAEGVLAEEAQPPALVRMEAAPTA